MAVRRKKKLRWIPPLKKWKGPGKKPGRKPNYRMRYYWRHVPRLPMGGNHRPPMEPKVYRYEVVMANHGREEKRLARFENKADAEKYFQTLKRKVDSVVFPQMTVTTKPMRRKGEGEETIRECIAARNEYLLLEKSGKESLPQRNMYGKFVEQKVSIEGWRILDKAQFRKEEKFAVFGYDNRRDRKTFAWIWENIAMDGEFKRICVLGRFIVFKNDDESMDVVTCKNKENARRFYSLLMDYAKMYKTGRLLFYGELGRRDEKGRRLAEEVLDATGWNREHLHGKR